MQGRRGAQQEARIVVGLDPRPELDQGRFGAAQVVVFKGQVPKAPEVGTWLILAGSATRWSLKMIEDVQKEDVGKVKNGRNPGRPGSSSSSLYLCLTVDSIQKESLNQHQELLQPTFCGSPPLSQQDSKV